MRIQGAIDQIDAAHTEAREAGNSEAAEALCEVLKAVAKLGPSRLKRACGGGSLDVRSKSAAVALFDLRDATHRANRAFDAGHTDGVWELAIEGVETLQVAVKETEFALKI